MKNNKFIKIAVVLLLCLAMVLPFVPLKAEAAVNYESALNSGSQFKGKKVSILGDSISTYEGVSNDSSANSTIVSNAVYYEENNSYGVQRDDTWWQQTIDMFDMQLCVNNSWSGSRVHNAEAGKTPAANANYFAWYDRAKQLHNASTGNPDVIAVYLGTNDLKDATSYKGFKANQAAIISEAATLSASSYNPTYHFSAYVRMVNEMLAKYTSAQIYLFTLLPHEAMNDPQRDAMAVYNQSIRDLVTYYQGQSKKVYLVDLYAATSITTDFEVMKKHLANTLHPNAEGMDVITNCFASSLVDNSGFASGTNNWREVAYDLTDVYVDGGQINQMRFSSASKYPFSVGLHPTRPEYDMEVKVELRKKDTTDYVDITSEAYSGGTVYINKVIHYNTYDQVKITAKAVYKTKNFRWEPKNGSFDSVALDGNTYNTRNGITVNKSNLVNGSYADGTFTNAQYSLQDSILLRNEEPWVLEWKATGTMSKDILFFSGDDTSATRCNTYIFYNNNTAASKKQLFIGYYNGRYSQYWNYGVDLPSTFTTGADISHTFRLVNAVATDGSNKVYLFVDGTQIGQLKNFSIADTAQTGALATEDWLNGRDLEFSFFGAKSSLLLNDCNIEYIQVWEGGEFDTLRLEQLIEEYDTIYAAHSDATYFGDYKEAVSNAKKYLNGLKDATNTQEKYDTFVADILAARNNLHKASSETKIYSTELLTRNYVPVGKPAGLKVITTPDVTSIAVDTQGLTTCTSEIQTLNIDGKDTEVKVWLVSWKRVSPTTGAYYTSEKRVDYTVKAFTSASSTTAAASKVITVPYGANCLVYVKMTKAPDKTTYFAGETFDATGMEITAYYGDGTQSKVVTDYTVTSTALTNTDTKVTVTYTESGVGTVTLDIPVRVLTNISDLDSCTVGDEIYIRGYYVGVADEGVNADKEMLFKDLETDDVIALRNAPVDDVINNNYGHGYEFEMAVTVGVDNDASTPNKRYISYDDTRNKSMEACIVSTGNAVTYKMDNVVKVSSWEEMQAKLQVGAIEPYTYVEIAAPLYICEYANASDGIDLYRPHMNAAATGYQDLKCGSRYISMRDNVMTKNLGADWLDLFLDSTTGITGYPGAVSNVRMYALYTGSNGTYFQLTVLRKDWVTPCQDVSEVMNYTDKDVLVEGYYVGISDEGYGSDKELLIKDLNTDDILAVRYETNVLPDFGWVIGDHVRFMATVKLDTNLRSPDKKYLQYLDWNNGVDTVLSSGNNVTYKLDNVKTIKSWTEMVNYFENTDICKYQYVKFDGSMFISTYTGSDDSVTNYRPHFNSNATGVNDLKITNGTARYVSIRSNVLEANVGSDILADIVTAKLASGKFPGQAFDGSVIAVFTGANGTYYSFAVLDADWIDLTAAA